MAEGTIKRKTEFRRLFSLVIRLITVGSVKVGDLSSARDLASYENGNGPLLLSRKANVV
jgi:hypothetical protein